MSQRSLSVHVEAHIKIPGDLPKLCQELQFDLLRMKSHQSGFQEQGFCQMQQSLKTMSQNHKKTFQQKFSLQTMIMLVLQI